MSRVKGTDLFALTDSIQMISLEEIAQSARGRNYQRSCTAVLHRISVVYEPKYKALKEMKFIVYSLGPPSM